MANVPRGQAQFRILTPPYACQRLGLYRFANKREVSALIAQKTNFVQNSDHQKELKGNQEGLVYKYHSLRQY